MRFRKNKLYWIQFWDHCQSDEVEDLMKVEVCGWVRSVTKEKVSITTWDVVTKDLDVKKANDSYYHIAKKLIIDVKIIN